MSSHDQTDFQARADRLADFVDQLIDSRATIDAVCEDGWPRSMVVRGFEMHSHTWRPAAVVAAVREELSAFGGVSALDGQADGTRVMVPEVISHIWPALPGAGVTPTLFGYLLGADQLIRPSSRGRSFARHFVDVWKDVIGESIELEPNNWWDADVVVVSGSDETVDEVRDIATARSAGRARVTGYGHRVSFALVDDADTPLERLAHKLATDIVMWDQKGCFSCRAVVFRGTRERCEALCEQLAVAISSREGELGAADASEAELARRAQARGTAEFTGMVWGDGIGWTTLVEEPWSGGVPSLHAVTVHRIADPDELTETITAPSYHLQGAALSAPDSSREMWARRVAKLGVTRICEPGRLQQPPAHWHHDGRPNVSGWLRLVDVDVRTPS